LSEQKLTLSIAKSVFIAFSITNTYVPIDEIIIHSCDTQNVFLDSCKCQKIRRVTRVKCLGLIIDCYLRWNIHVKNLVMRLRSVIFKIYTLNKFLSKGIIYTIYNALYKSILQYGLIVWGGCADNEMRSLITQQNHAVRICLNKYDLKGSSVTNYKELKVLPIRSLYKQFAILRVSKNISQININKRECIAYDLQVKYAKKILVYIFWII
jgi:hypothetical protein